MKNNNETKEKVYCTRPFDHAQTLDSGEVVPCCPAWVNHYSLGNINEQSFEEIWNGEKAQKIRESMIDGSFRYCNAKSCQHMAAKTYCVGTLEQLEERKVDGQILADIRESKTVLDHGPHEIQFSHDRSCNLSCPSCRRSVIMVAGKKQKELLKIQDKLQADFLKDSTRLFVTGSGDAFASPTFRKFFQTLTEEQAPKLQHINILSNGLLLKKYWHTVNDFAKAKIEYISISIDASTPETYSVNRRGGDWDLLHENLEFIRALRLDGRIKGFQISFVTQENNFHEMKDFTLMGEKYNVDAVQFQIIEPDFIRDLGYGDYLKEWKEKAVHEKTHPRHKELIEIITSDFFEPYIDRYNGKAPAGTAVAMGVLGSLREGLDISQYDQLLIEQEELNRVESGLKLVEKGLLKDIWFEGEAYFIALDAVKKINGTDVAELPTGETVIWDEDKEKWAKYHAY
jgi:radical SAM protein with 4Fe4S-binding SPASM domain